jgi:hypothetical protein
VAVDSQAVALDAHRRLRELADLVVPLALRAVADARVADALAAGALPVAQLAAATGTQADALARVLRALVARGAFAEPEPDVFALNPVAELLLGEHPLSLRDGYPLMESDLLAWSGLGHALRTGRPAFDHAHGCGYYDHLAGDDALRARFDRSVEAQNRLMLRAMLPAYDWASSGTIVDVAGGTGVFLAGLLAARPALSGVLFDLPHVVRDAPPVLAAAGVAERAQIVGGSFFEELPAGADTYVLKTVLHDWGDDDAARILGVLARAMTPSSRAVVIEALLPAGDAFHLGKLLDVNSLVLVGGPDRDEPQLCALLTAAGLATRAVTHTPTLGVIEVALAGDGAQVNAGSAGSPSRSAPRAA